MYWGIMAKTPDFWNVSDHGVWAIFLIFEIFVNKIRIVKSHWKVLTIVVFIALLINIIVTLAHKPVYKVVTYDDVASFIYVVILVILIFGNYFLSCKF